MKIKTVLVAGLAGGIGYVLGTKAGTSRYDEIRAKADQLAKSPQVQETVANIAEGVKRNATKLPDPVADVVTSVADKATGGSSSSGSSAGTSPSSGIGVPPSTESTFSPEPSFSAGSSFTAGSSFSTESSFDTTPTTTPDLDLAETSDLSDPTRHDSTSTLGDSTTSLDEPTDPFVEPVRTSDPFDPTDQPHRNI